jgi:hypothetical protein
VALGNSVYVPGSKPEDIYMKKWVSLELLFITSQDILRVYQGLPSNPMLYLPYWTWAQGGLSQGYSYGPTPFSLSGGENSRNLSLDGAFISEPSFALLG